MAEEETGFTFVDKRRAAPEAPAAVQDAPEAPAAAAPPTAEAPSVAGVQADTQEAGVGEDGLGEDGPGEDPGPPSTYDLIGYCLNLMAQQAWQKLGLLADPQTGEARPDLAEAKVAIDTVGDLAGRLETAPETIIPADFRRDLRTLLNDLRLNYVSQSGSSLP